MVKKQRKLLDSIRENPWIASTFFLGVICLILITGFFGQVQLIEEPPKVIEGFDEVDVCSKITGTPSWADDEGNIITSGYQSFGNVSWDVVNGELIPKKVHFLYSSTCGWCLEQIKYFGNTWPDYVNSGLTHDCKEILSG